LFQTDYPLLSRILHRIALAPDNVRMAAYDLQCSFSKRQDKHPVVKPVFIAGLARSGSTTLLNLLYDTQRFRSLSYQDMPFIMMPGVWQSLRGISSQKTTPKERAHGDRIAINEQSPEAFEEVFWLTFCEQEYVEDSRLVTHTPSSTTRQAFNQFVQHVLQSGSSGNLRYLSKNNNNILRIPALQQTFADAVILVPFRSPLQQAASLLRQHQRFTQRHQGNNFEKNYMKWLGHFEFGANHRAFNLDDSHNDYAPEDLNYWLQTWLDVYSYILSFAPETVTLIGYEAACAAPEAFCSKLEAVLQVQPQQWQHRHLSAAEPHLATGFDEKLLRRCEHTHAQLRLHCLAENGSKHHAEGGA
jgi:hypothetical protein